MFLKILFLIQELDLISKKVNLFLYALFVLIRILYKYISQKVLRFYSHIYTQYYLNIFHYVQHQSYLLIFLQTLNLFIDIGLNESIKSTSSSTKIILPIK